MTNQTELIPIKEPKLTLKQRRFLKRYFETGNGTKAALEVYDTDDPVCAASIARENLRKLQSPIKTYMENQGIGLNVLVGVLAGGLQAQKWNDFTGEREPDHATRHKFLSTAARWLEVEKPENAPPEGVKRRIVAEEFFETEEK